MEPYIEGAASSGRRRTRRKARKYARSISKRSERRRFAKSKRRKKVIESIVGTGITLRTTGAALSLLPK